MESSLHDLMAWLHANSEWLAFSIFLTAFLETLVMVGLILPGVVMLFALASLAGSGALGIWPAMLCAFVGAVLGDTISYSLGRRFHDRIKSWWPFRQHQRWIASGEQFFLKYGGLSVAIGRFVGPIRPIIPLVAGMMDMPVQRFWLANVLSAIFWAPVYLVPGFLVGAAVTHVDTLDQLYEVVLSSMGLAITAGFVAAATGEFIQRKSGSSQLASVLAFGSSLMLVMVLSFTFNEFWQQTGHEVSDKLSLIQQPDLVALLNGLNIFFCWPVMAGIFLVTLGGMAWYQGIRPALMFFFGAIIVHLISWRLFESHYQVAMTVSLFSSIGLWAAMTSLRQKPWFVRGTGYAAFLCVVGFSCLALIWGQDLGVEQAILSVLLGNMIVVFGDYELGEVSVGKSG